ncbi:hypothetical protein [Terricaulis sp.]|uniref:hypothetical protein n=1 Tax=Terricaulis sp. TaxID=2768686 RepID=UPI003783E2FB
MAGAEKKTGSSAAGLRFLTLSAALLSPACANAGAWIAPEHGQTIDNAAITAREDGAAYEISAYIEVPITARISSVSTGWGEWAEADPTNGRTEATLGIKYAILRTEHAAMAVQAGAIWNINPNEGCSEGGAEVRWLGGMNLSDRSFANLEIAARGLEGGAGCLGSRAELTLGHQFGSRWLGMGQAFVDSPLDGDDSIKVQASLVRFGADGRRGIQLGLRARLDGGAPEPALVLGLWRRLGD